MKYLFWKMKWWLVLILVIGGALIVLPKANAKWGTETNDGSSTGPCPNAPKMDVCELPPNPCSFKAELVPLNTVAKAIRIKRIENVDLSKCSTNCVVSGLENNTFVAKVKEYAKGSSYAYTHDVYLNNYPGGVWEIPIKMWNSGPASIEILEVKMNGSYYVNGNYKSVSCSSGNLGNFAFGGVVSHYAPYADAWLAPESDFTSKYSDMTAYKNSSVRLYHFTNMGGAFEVHCVASTVKDFDHPSGFGGLAGSSGNSFVDTSKTGDFNFYVGCRASNGGSVAWDQVTLHVIEPPPTVDLWTNNNQLQNVKSGSVNIDSTSDVNLYWSTTNMSSNQCQVTSSPNVGSWSGNKNNSGNINLGKLSANTTYKFTITCNNGNGSDSDDVTVVIGPPRIDGVCGTASSSYHTFQSTETCPGAYTLCSAGAVSGFTSCPSAGRSSTYSCVGSGPGGTTAWCTVSRSVNNPSGYHDGADCSMTWGWACDADNYNQSLQIHLYDSSTFIGSTTANIYGQDLVNAGVCGGNGYHRFSYAIPESLKDGNYHYIYAYGINIGDGSNQALSGTPKLIRCTNLAPVLTGVSASCNGLVNISSAYDPEGKAISIYLYDNTTGKVISSSPTWMGANSYQFSFTPTKDGSVKTLRVVVTDGTQITYAYPTYVCPLCGAAATTYKINDSFPPSANYCVGGGPIYSKQESSIWIWKCYENGAGSYASSDCTATKYGNPLTITDLCPATKSCGDPQIDVTVTGVSEPSLAQNNYVLNIRKGDCSSETLLQTLTNSSAPVFNWKPDVSTKSLKDIYNATLCYQVTQNGVVIGQEIKTYNCPVPSSIQIVPATVNDVESNTNTTLDTKVLCTDNSTIIINRDTIATNSITWDRDYSPTLTTCSPGLSIDYINSDNYNYHTGQGMTDCSGTVSATISNFITNGFGWGTLNGSFATSIKKTEFVISGDTCPTCGTKYMNVNITVPLMQCS